MLIPANYTDSQLVTRPWKHNSQLVTEKSLLQFT